MNGTETLAAWSAAIIAVGTLLIAWKNIREGAISLWTTFGWHGSFWRFLVNAVHAVDVVMSIPKQLAALETGQLELRTAMAAQKRETGLLKRQVIAVQKSSTAHIRVADSKTELLGTIADRLQELGILVPLAQEIHHEVRNNSGTSLKDSTHRLERALGLPEPTEQGQTTTD